MTQSATGKHKRNEFMHAFSKENVEKVFEDVSSVIFGEITECPVEQVFEDISSVITGEITEYIR